MPYLGAWLTDLTFIGESRTWIDRTEEKFPPLLNISKLSKIAGVLMAIQQFQKLPFPFCHQKDISYYLMSEVSAAPRRKDQELYEISIALEVRKKEILLCLNVDFFSFKSHEIPTFSKKWLCETS